jgi:hypothetical protein
VEDDGVDYWGTNSVQPAAEICLDLESEPSNYALELNILESDFLFSL